jgi:hypothetical protein
LFDKVEFANIDKELYSIRMHNGSVSAIRRDNQLKNSFKAFSSFVGDSSVCYDDFLSLLMLKTDINPVRRLVSYLRASRRTGIHLRSLIRDNRDYLKLWMK